MKRKPGRDTRDPPGGESGFGQSCGTVTATQWTKPKCKTRAPVPGSPGGCLAEEAAPLPSRPRALGVCVRTRAACVPGGQEDTGRRGAQSHVRPGWSADTFIPGLWPTGGFLSETGRRQGRWAGAVHTDVHTASEGRVLGVSRDSQRKRDTRRQTRGRAHEKQSRSHRPAGGETGDALPGTGTELCRYVLSRGGKLYFLIK